MALNLRREKSEKLTDNELLDKYLISGDLDLLGLLYSRYMDLVYGLCLKYFREKERAQDAVMDIFEKIIIELGRHEVKGFRSWLYVLAKNYCLMELRSSKKEIHKTVDIHDHEYLFMEKHPEMHPMDSDNINNDKALEECIEQLKEEQRACVRLFYFKNMCYRDIASQMKTDEKKVKSYLQNARRNLKICLEGKNEK